MAQARHAAEAVGDFVIIVGVLAGILLCGWQALTWFQLGWWPPISVLDGMQWFGMHWASSPASWPDLYSMLDSIPLAVAIPVIGIVCGALLSLAGD